MGAKKKSKSTEKLQVAVPSDVTVKESKHQLVFKRNGKRAAVIGRRVFLSNHLAKLPASFTELSKEDAAKKHLGVTRSVGKVADAAELERVLKVYFK